VFSKGLQVHLLLEQLSTWEIYSATYSVVVSPADVITWINVSKFPTASWTAYVTYHQIILNLWPVNQSDFLSIQQTESLSLRQKFGRVLRSGFERGGCKIWLEELSSTSSDFEKQSFWTYEGQWPTFRQLWCGDKSWIRVQPEHSS
jgi:hypothetical protein